MKVVHSKSSKGQTLIIIALAFVVLLAFIGFAVDVGQVFIYNGHLRRAVDSGSLAAAAQFREGRSTAQMAAAADEVMSLNGVDPATVIVETCNTNPGDPALCVTPKRKFVRVIASVNVPMSFLSVIGIRTVPLTAQAISEAAAMDVVLVMDVSESMANDSGLCDGDDDDGDGIADDGRMDGMCPGGLPAIPARGTWDNYYSDPSRCNPANNCQPMEKVKDAAKNFVNRILDLPASEEADRVAIVAFSRGWRTSASDPQTTRYVTAGWVNDNATAIDAIDNLKVFEPDPCITSVGPCRLYDNSDAATGNYLGISCPLYYQTGDPASCTSTNIGGGLKLAGNMFAYQTREDALWVVILLTDGAANASDPDSTHDYGFCPPTTWSPPFCRDKSTTTRHLSGDPNYDADDFARDMADFVGCYPTDPAAACSQPGQGAVIFTIGLGDQVLDKYGTDPIPPGVSLLRYIAAVGDDGNSATDPCADLYNNDTEFKTWCGNYYYSPSGDRLSEVFEDIASRMFTRITH